MNVTIIMINVNTLSRKQQELRRAFQSAESVDETLKAFKDMEACFDESDLGMECWMVARKLLREDRAPEEVIRFGKRALGILIGNDNNNIPCFGKSCSGICSDHESGGSSCTVYHKSSLFIACVLHLLGSTCVDLKRYDESLSYLNWANRNLSKLEEDDDPCSCDCVLHAIIAIQCQLFRVKVPTGRFGEAALHMRKILEIKEKMMEEGCIELGEANKDVCTAYCAAMNLKEALPFCLKAVEIHTKHLGHNSVEVAQMRSTLRTIYHELGEYEKAHEQKQLAESVLKKTTPPNSPNSLIESGRYEEAIGVLKGEVSRDDMEGDKRASAFVSMARAFVKLGKFADAKKCMRTAQTILEKKDIIPIYVAILFEHMSRLYEEMNDSETALSLIRRLLAIPELPYNLRSNGSKRFFSLISQSAIPVDEMLKAFKEMEACFEESELGPVCWKIASELLNQGRSPEEVICFGKRALRILIANDNTNIPCFGKICSGVSIGIGKTGSSCTHNHNSSLYIACVCNLLASACLELKRYDESLSYSNWANRNLSMLGEEDNNPCTDNCVLHALLATQHVLFRIKVARGRWEDCVTHLRKKLEIKEKIMEEGCIELGEANEHVSGAYIVLMNFIEALPFCLKSLEIHTKHLGHNSVEVARMMGHLALIYNELGEYEKALEQNQLSQNILKKTTPDSPELLKGENDHGKILIGLGRYEEAIGVLKGVVSHTDTEGSIRGISFVSMARAFCNLEKFADAKKFMRKAQKIIEKKEMNSVCVAIGLLDMSRLYEKMNDYETAISLLRRVLAIPGIAPKLLAQGSVRLFSLISLAGKEKEGIPYMVDTVEKLKESFGPEHCEVGYGYRKLGAAYLKSGKEELAVKFMVNAKDIMHVTLGPHHLDSLKTSQTLAETYATMRRYHEALEIEEKVVEGLKGLEPGEPEFLDEAVKLLSKMKERVTESPTRASPQSKDEEDLSAKISKCGILDDGKVLK